MSRNWDKKWKLEYWIGSKLVETLVNNQPYAVCVGTLNKKALLPNYRSGKFKITPVFTQV